MKNLAALCAGAVLAASPMAAAEAATIYTGTRTMAPGATAELSITTNDTIGVLDSADIVDWTIVLNEGGQTFTLRGPASGNNSGLLLSGSALTATASELRFNFSGSGMFLIQAPNVGSGQTFYCAQTNGCFDFSGPGEAVEAGTTYQFARVARSGVVVLATAGPGAIPEPGTWALLILGFGAIGAAMRRRQTSATVSFA